MEEQSQPAQANEPAAASEQQPIESPLTPRRAAAPDQPGPPSRIIAWATQRRPRPGKRERRSGETLMAIVAVTVSAVVVAALVTTLRQPSGDQPPLAAETPTATGRGDPALAQSLAARADQLPGGDVVGRIRLLLAAHIVDPASAARRAGLAEAVLGSTSPSADAALTPTELMRADLNTKQPVTYAAISTDGSYLITSGPSTSQIWQARQATGDWFVQLAERIDQPTIAGAGGGNGLATTFILVQPDGVAQAVVTNTGQTFHSGPLAHRADAVAVTSDGRLAIIVDSTTTTVWQVGQPQPEAAGTLSDDLPVTSVVFAPDSTTVAAAHIDGTVTLHHIELNQEHATKRILESSDGSIDAVALVADNTAIATHADGTLNVWDLRADQARPVGAAPAGTGPHQAWLHPSGDFAITADATGQLTLWSLTNRAHPKPLRSIATPSNAPVPTAISSDGRVAMVIGRDSTLVVLSLDPIGNVINDPTELACRLARPTNDEWRQLVPNPAYPNPCKPPPLPTFD